MGRILLVIYFSVFPLSCFSFEKFAIGENSLYLENMSSNGVHFEFIFNVGTANQDCMHYHDLHILEHLVYSGLNSLLIGYGIQNPIVAETEMLRIRFSFDLPASFTDDPEKTRRLFKILMSPNWQAFDVEKASISREFVEQKNDGEYINAFLDLYKLSIPSIGSVCTKLPRTDEINVQDVKQTFIQVYSKATRSVVVTGSFNSSIVKQIANEEYGVLNQKSAPDDYESTYKANIAILENKIIVAVPVPGLKSFSGHNLIVMRNLIRSRLIEDLRNKSGLVYSVDAQIKSNDRFGMITIEIPVANKHINLAISTIEDVLMASLESQGDIERSILFLSNQYRSNDVTKSSRGVQIGDYLLEIMPFDGYPNNFKNPLSKQAKINVADYRSFSIWRSAQKILEKLGG